MAKVVKKTPPSRVRYEAANPTVSCRVPKEVYDRLRAVMKAEGRSMADVLKVGLGLLEVEVSKKKEAREQGFGEGYEGGFEDAADLYRVTYPCKICGKTLEVTSANEKKAISKYMQEHGWGHAECHNGKG